jgi:arylsulfatase A-like enzyme
VLWPGSPFGLHHDEVTLPEVLREAGYKTGMIGKWHLGDPPKFNPVNQGFDEFFGVFFSNDMNPYKYYRNEQQLDEEVDRDQQVIRYTDEAVKFIRQHKDEPFFLYMAHAMPHVPLAASEKFRGKSQRGLYGDAVAELDWSVGQVLEELRKLKLDENTFVIFTSDNGGWLARGEEGGLNTPLRGGKGTSYQGGFCVPTIVWQPGVVPAGETCEQLLASLDLLPSFAAMAGGKTTGDRKIDGLDASAVFKGQPGAKTPREHFFYYFGNELHGVRSGPWKLRTKNLLKNENIYNKEWREGEVGDTPVPAALYNLEQDPGEQKSVLRDHPKIAERLRGYLDQARADLGDSLNGKAPTNDRAIGRQ